MSDFGSAMADVFEQHKDYFGQAASYVFADGSTLAATVVPSLLSALGVAAPTDESTRGRVVFRLALADLGGKTLTANEDTVLFQGQTYVVEDAPPSVDGATVEVAAVYTQVKGFGMRGRKK